jgi:hypothetical protein
LKCEAESTNPDAKHILRQYGDLIKKLGGNIMNKPIMEKFYKMMVEGENLKTALSLRAMFDELISYRLERIIDKFKNDPGPFQKLLVRDGLAVFQRFQDPGLTLAVYAVPESYGFSVWDEQSQDQEVARGHAEVILKEMGVFDEYRLNEYSQFTTIRTFEFPSEEEILYEHISTFKRRLREAIKSVSRSP